MQARSLVPSHRSAARAAGELASPAQLRGPTPKKFPKKAAQRLASSPRLAADAQRRTSLFADVAEPVQRQANRSGLPDQLKSGVEQLAGVSMDDVRVHHNSPRPAALQAQAYAQGSEIHLGPGQAHHLPHEAWHVAQQKQGRVQPTMQVSGVPVNDAAGLEHEADVMGRRALQAKAAGDRHHR